MTGTRRNKGEEGLLERAPLKGHTEYWALEDSLLGSKILSRAQPKAPFFVIRLELLKRLLLQQQQQDFVTTLAVTTTTTHISP